MDDLTNIRARLTEMVEAKLARAKALRAEADAIDRELVEAQAMLGGVPAAAPVLENVVMVEDDFARRRREHKEKRATHVIRMTRQSVLAHLSAVGPQSADSLMRHFGYADGRGVNVLRIWSNSGHLVRQPDGRFAAPGVPHVVAIAPRVRTGGADRPPAGRDAEDHLRFVRGAV